MFDGVLVGPEEGLMLGVIVGWFDLERDGPTVWFPEVVFVCDCCSVGALLAEPIGI